MLAGRRHEAPPECAASEEQLALVALCNKMCRATMQSTLRTHDAVRPTAATARAPRTAWPARACDNLPSLCHAVQAMFYTLSSALSK